MATTEIYTLSLHDALPISRPMCGEGPDRRRWRPTALEARRVSPCAGRGSCDRERDRKSTRLNSSHANISYAVFCLKKKKHAIKSSRHQMSYPRKITIVHV